MNHLNKQILFFGTVASVAILCPELFAHLAHAADAVIPAASPLVADAGIPLILPSSTPIPSSSTVASVVQIADLSGADFFSQVWTVITGFGGMGFMMKFSAVITVIIASMKVSFARPLWDKLGYFKALVTPILSLILGIISLAVAGKVTLAALAAYLFSGGGAIILHEVLDQIKAIPGLSPVYLNMIAFFSKILGGPTPLPADNAIPSGMGTATNPSAKDNTTTS